MFNDKNFFIPLVVLAMPALIASKTLKSVQKQTQKIQNDSMVFLTKTFKAIAFSF